MEKEQIIEGLRNKGICQFIMDNSEDLTKEELTEICIEMSCFIDVENKVIDSIKRVWETK